MADLAITAANVKNVDADLHTGTAGETIIAGQGVYKKSADSKLYKAQCDGTAEEADAVGIAMHGSLADQPLTYAKGGTINIGATTAKGSVYAVSAAAGGVAPTADLASGNRVTHLGFAKDNVGAFVVKVTNSGVTL